MKELTIEGQQMTSKKAMYLHLDRVFAFPHHFGNNLDALWDVLSTTNEPTIIYFENTDEFIDHMNDYGKKLIKLLQKLEQENENYTIHFYEGERQTE